MGFFLNKVKVLLKLGKSEFMVPVPIYISNLLTSCKLHEHVYETEQRATKMFDDLVDQLAKQEGVTEQLKAEDAMLWVGKMNNIRHRSKEIVFSEMFV